MEVYDFIIENDSEDTYDYVYLKIDDTQIFEIEILPKDYVDLELLQEIDFKDNIKVYHTCHNTEFSDLIATITKEEIKVETEF